jgi:hypothetical protein
MRGVLKRVEDPYSYPPEPSRWQQVWRKIKSFLSDKFDYIRGITPLEAEHDILVHQLRRLAIDVLTTDSIDVEARPLFASCK